MRITIGFNSHSEHTEILFYEGSVSRKGWMQALITEEEATEVIRDNTVYPELYSIAHSCGGRYSIWHEPQTEGKPTFSLYIFHSSEREFHNIAARITETFLKNPNTDDLKVEKLPLPPQPELQTKPHNPKIRTNGIGIRIIQGFVGFVENFLGIK